MPTEPVRLSSGIPLECKFPRASANVQMTVMILGEEQQEYAAGQIQFDGTYTVHINTTLMVNVRAPQVTTACVVVWKHETLSDRKNVTLHCE